MSVAIPPNLKYNTKIESASARSYKANIQPNNGMGPYQDNQTIIINIPTNNNLCLVTGESYLKFDLELKNGPDANAYMRMDSCGAHGVIERIRVLHGTNVISDISEYGMLAKIMMDIQTSTDASYGKNSILVGTRTDLTVRGAAANVLSAQQTNSGYRFNDVTSQDGGVENNGGGVTTFAAIAGGATTSKRTFCLNLLSIVGTLSGDRYFPLFAATGSRLSVEIKLVTNASKFVCSNTVFPATGSFTITNCEYIASMLELSDSAMAAIINQSTGGPLQYVVTDIANFSTTSNISTSTGTTQMSIPIGAKYSSLKAMFIALRSSDNIGKIEYFPYSSNKHKIEEYSFRIGSNQVPANPPRTSTEMFSELLKSISSMSDINHQPSIDYYSYNQDYSIKNNDTAVDVGSNNSGSFYIGLDLENYSGTDRSNLFAGMNTNTSDTALNIRFGPNDKPRLITFNTYALFDQVVMFENGSCFVKF